jgi:flagellar biosynthesis protein FliP
MELYKELSGAIDECLSNKLNTSEFNNRFRKLIENFFSKSTNDADIKEIIDLVDWSEAN